MATVVRLETFADIDGEVADRHQLSVALRQEAVLDDGRRMPLLDDRGWGSSINRSSSDDIWSMTSIEDIEETARVVVGPDEPPDGLSAEDMAAGHWATLADALARQGVAVDGAELRVLPHDVVLSERLRGRVGHRT